MSSYPHPSIAVNAVRVRPGYWFVEALNMNYQPARLMLATSGHTKPEALKRLNEGLVFLYGKKDK